MSANALDILFEAFLDTFMLKKTDQGLTLESIPTSTHMMLAQAHLYMLEASN